VRIFIQPRNGERITIRLTAALKALHDAGIRAEGGGLVYHDGRDTGIILLRNEPDASCALTALESVGIRAAT
jgi:hypothetical protein